MKTKITPVKLTFSIIIYLLTLTFGFAQSIFANEITGTNPKTYNPYILNQVLNTNITSTGIGRGTGIEGKDKITNIRLRIGTVMPLTIMTILNLR